MRVGLGAGIIVAVLLPVVLLLFGLLGDVQTVAAILLLVGLWTAIYGLAFAKARDRLYDVGFGVIVALLSTLDFLPVQYAVGLVLVWIIALVVTSTAVSRKPRSS